MKTYLLLRNNKVKGPYSIGEMKLQDLQEKDLIWIEGESITWKYPSEIREFRNYTDTVAEHSGTIINNRKEKQIIYFRNYIGELGFSKNHIGSIEQPDAFASDVPNGYEYLVMADQRRKPVDFSICDKILEDVLQEPVEEEIAATPDKVLGAPQLIDTAEVTANQHFISNSVELAFRYKSNISADNIRNKRRGSRGWGQGLAAWAGLITTALMCVKW